MDVEARNTHQRVVQRNFTHNARNQRVHGNPLLPDALQNAARRLHDREQHHRQAGNHQQRAAGHDVLFAQRTLIEEAENLLAEHAHADRAGQPDQERKAQAEIRLPLHRVHILHCPRGGNCWNERHADRQRQRRGNVNQADDHAAEHAVRLDGCIMRQTGNDAAVDQHRRVNELRQGHDARANCNRDGYHHQLFCNAFGGCVLFRRKLWNRVEAASAAEVKQNHVQQGNPFDDGCAKQCACRAHRHAAHLIADIRHRQRQKHLADLLNQLADGGRHHVLLSLYKAAERRHHAHNRHTRCNHLKADFAVRLIHARRQHSAARQHDDGCNASQSRQQQQGDTENVLGAVRVILRQRGGYHSADRDGQPGG